eukprot:Nitzschia sp. Nitz4//scaffold289_size23394//5989//6649//NITZ4_008476-RA/size23394-processed-gene-0.11-mRNA-1//-1//CDS//3329545819//1834//frame0
MTGFVARTLVRRSLQMGLRKVVAPPQMGALRFATYYTPAHEYVDVEGTVGTCGITDFAQEALGDIVFVDLPEVGDDYNKGESFGSVESVKAASDVYSPVSGKILEVNEEIVDAPDLVNSAAESDGWFMKIEISDASELESLMDAAAYKEHCEKEA